MICPDFWYSLFMSFVCLFSVCLFSFVMIYVCELYVKSALYHNIPQICSFSLYTLITTNFRVYLILPTQTKLGQIACNTCFQNSTWWCTQQIKISYNTMHSWKKRKTICNNCYTFLQYTLLQFFYVPGIGKKRKKIAYTTDWKIWGYKKKKKKKKTTRTILISQIEKAIFFVQVYNTNGISIVLQKFTIHLKHLIIQSREKSKIPLSVTRNWESSKEMTKPGTDKRVLTRNTTDGEISHEHTCNNG